MVMGQTYVLLCCPVVKSTIVFVFSGSQVIYVKVLKQTVFSRDNEIIFLSSQGSTLIITR